MPIRQSVKDAAQSVQRRLLGVLNRESFLSEHAPNSRGPKHVYAGTANRKAVSRRRAKNKVARRSRRINRGR